MNLFGSHQKWTIDIYADTLEVSAEAVLVHSQLHVFTHQNATQTQSSDKHDNMMISHSIGEARTLVYLCVS